MSSPLRFRWHAFFCYVLVVAVVSAANLPAQIQIGPGAMSTGSTDPVTISGRVMNAISGTPVSRALVRFNDRAMLTGHDGSFEFDQVTDEFGNLQVIKPGYYSSIEPGGAVGMVLHTSQVANPLELRLYPEAIFTGTVTAPDGEPLPHVLVSAWRSSFDDNGHRWAPVAQSQTDSHGRFRVPVPAGDYKLKSMYVGGRQSDQAILPLKVPADSSTNSSDFIHMQAGEEQSFALRPVTSKAYTVTVTFDSNVTRGFPRITAHSSSGVTIPLSINNSPRSRSFGGTHLELPRGTYTLTADVMSADGAAQAETTVTITDHDVSGIVFHLAPIPTLPVELQVDGAATSDNSPPGVQQLGLTLENIESDPDVLNSTIRPTGGADRGIAFTVPAGSYRLRASGNGAWYVKSAAYGASDLLQQDLVVGPGVGGTPIRITVSNQTGSLQGTCKLNGAPAACFIYLIPTSASAKSVFTMQGNTQGSYSNASLPPGSYQAIAFEQRHLADYGSSLALAPFASHVSTVMINAGDKATLDLNTVSAAEMAP